MILQHPQEQDRALGTARLTALHFKHAVLKIGLSWPSLSKALGRPVADPSRWAVLYLGSAKVADLETDRDIVAIDRKGAARGQPARHPEGYRGHRAARRHLEPGQGAVVAQRLDAEVPARHSRTEAAVALTASCAANRGGMGSSTIEAAAMLLGSLEKRPDIAATLNDSFERMLAKYREAQTVLPELAPKTKAAPRLPPPKTRPIIGLVAYPDVGV